MNLKNNLINLIIYKGLKNKKYIEILIFKMALNIFVI